MSINHLRPVVATPFIKKRWPSKKIRNIGIKESIDMENREPHADSPSESTNALSPKGTVYISGFVRYSSGVKKSFQFQMKLKIAAVAKAGVIRGMITCQ